MSKKLQQVAVPLVSVLLGLLLGAIIMWAFGYDAIWGYELLFNKAFGSIKSFGEITRAMGPLILIGLGFSVASRAGFFNVGLPGQAFAGWIMASWFALLFGNNVRPILSLVSWPIALLITVYVSYKLFLHYKVKFEKENNNLKFYGIFLLSTILSFAIIAGFLQICMLFLPERFLVISATIIMGLVSGGLVGAIPGILRAYLGTSEVIITIMMNYIVLYMGNAFIHSFPANIMRNKDSSIDVAANAVYQTSWLKELTDGSRANIGIFFAIIAVVIIWFMMKKTTLGFEIRAVGLNPNASEYAGMSAKRTIILSMIISGALAGLGGVVEGIGTYSNIFVQGSSMSVGFNGMAVALLAMNSPVGIPFAAFLFGALQIGGPGMNRATIPVELVQIVTASIIFFVSIHYIIEKFIKPRKAQKGGK